ncbi:MAG: hypothetical protein JSR90_06405 [Proteobacteria bacterium]|nr:hypothetical protein [Pseudomonadota bacterium]
MSQARNARRLRRLEGGGATSVGAQIAAINAAYGRELTAALALAAFAQALAGSDRAARADDAGATSMPEAARPATVVTAPLRAPASRWTTSFRPGPHDVLTWEEAMRVPWIDETGGAS